MENKVKTTTISELEARIAGLINKSDSLPDTLYADENEQEKQLEAMANIEAGYKALSRQISATEKNRWGYSPAGWLSKKLISKHLNSVKNGIYSIFPIPCKRTGCPYGESCIALKNNMAPPYGEPCVIETAKIENLIVSYANDFDFNTASTTDKILIQELIQTDLLMDRCQIMMAQEGRMLQDVTMGVTEEGEVYTQQVVSRYLDAWEKLSRRRENLFNQMDSTRRAKRGQKADVLDDEDALAKIVDVHEGFFEVEKRPEKFNVKEDE